MKLLGQGNFGYAYEESGKFLYIWVSDDIAQQPLKDIIMSWQMWMSTMKLSGRNHPCKKVIESHDFLATLYQNQLEGRLLLVKNEFFSGKGWIFSSN